MNDTLRKRFAFGFDVLFACISTSLFSISFNGDVRLKFVTNVRQKTGETELLCAITCDPQTSVKGLEVNRYLKPMFRLEIFIVDFTEIERP